MSSGFREAVTERRAVVGLLVAVALATGLTLPAAAGAATRSGEASMSAAMCPPPPNPCNLQILHIQYVTSYEGPHGRIVDTHNSLVGVPTVLTADHGVFLADVLPVPGPGGHQLVGSLTVKLLITRIAGPPDLPVRIELITHDPRSIGSASRVSFGYDAVDSTAPRFFDADLQILSTSNPLHLAATVSTVSARAHQRLALIGSTFDLLPDGSRGGASPASAAIDFNPMPPRIGADMTLDSGSQDIKLNSAEPTTVTAHAFIGAPANQRQFGATVDQLPTSAEVNVDDSGKVTYNASAPIGLVRATVQSTKPLFGRATLVDAAVHHAPSSFVLTFSGGDGQPIELRSSVPLPEVDAVAGDGNDGGLDGQGVVTYAPVHGDDGVTYIDTPDKFFTYVRVSGLSLVRYAANSTDGSLSGELDTTGGHIVDLHSIIQNPGDVPFEANGTIDKLPSTVKFTMQKSANGRFLTYDGSAPIDTITLDMTGVPKLGAVSALIHQLPKHVEARIDPDDKEYSISTADPHGPAIGLAEFRIADQPADFPQFRATPGYWQGGTFSDTADGFTMVQLPGTLSVGLRVTGLRSAFASLAADNEPLNGVDVSVGANVDPSLARPFGLHVLTPNADGSTNIYDGWLSQLEPNTSLAIGHGGRGGFSGGPQDLLAHVIEYQADAPLPKLDFESNVAGSHTFMHAIVQNIPDRLQLCFGKGDDQSKLCTRYGATLRPPDTWDNHHQAALDLEDFGSAKSDMVVNMHLCLDQPNPVKCDSQDEISNFGAQPASDNFVLVKNLHVRNIGLDVDAERCDNNLLLCGHLAIDTRNQPASGKIIYYNRNASNAVLTYGVYADLAFAPGFSADARYSHFEFRPLVGDLALASWTTQGTATCPPVMDWPAIVHDNDGVIDANVNLAYQWFCNPIAP